MLLSEQVRYITVPHPAEQLLAAAVAADSSSGYGCFPSPIM